MIKAYKEFSWIKSQVQWIKWFKKDKVWKIESLKWFWQRTKYVLKLTFTEKEILFFALLQWLSIALAYYLWVQMLGWIPDEVWESAKNSDEWSIADIILYLWSFICVWIAAFPLWIFSWCMWATYLLKKQTWNSDIASCLKIVTPNSLLIWFFSWIDWWFTVNRILDRIPKKNDKTTPQERALSELLYYAWKIWTIGILPALVTWRKIWTSVKYSVFLVKNKMKDVMILRWWYSLLCWIIWVWTYILGIFIVIKFPDLFQSDWWTSNEVLSFYSIMWLPILFSVAIILLFIRPIYIISSFIIYTDFLTERWDEITIPQPAWKWRKALVFFLFFCLLVFLLYLYRDTLWITDMLSVPYWEEYIK